SPRISRRSLDVIHAGSSLPLPRGEGRGEGAGSRLRPPLARFRGIEQLVAIHIKLVEYPPRAQKLVPNQIAIVVAVHPLEPDRPAELPALKSRRLCRWLVARSEKLIGPAREFDMKMPHALILLNAGDAVALQLRERRRGQPLFPLRNAAVRIRIQRH